MRAMRYGRDAVRLTSVSFSTSPRQRATASPCVRALARFRLDASARRRLTGIVVLSLLGRLGHAQTTTPVDQPDTVRSNQQNLMLPFTVYNDAATTGIQATFTCTTTGAVYGCVPPNSMELPADGSGTPLPTTLYVRFNSAGPGTGTLVLNVTTSGDGGGGDPMAVHKLRVKPSGPAVRWRDGLSPATSLGTGRGSYLITVIDPPPVPYPTITGANESATIPGLLSTSSASYALTQRLDNGSWQPGGAITGEHVTVAPGTTVTFSVGATDAAGLTSLSWDVYDETNTYVTTYHSTLSGTSATASIAHALTRAGTWRVHAHVTNTYGKVSAVVLTADVGNPGAPQLTIANPKPIIARDLCLTVGISRHVAAECGDLRIVHPLRTVRTLNTDRTPTLIYSSSQAQPIPIVAVNVTLGANVAVPDSVIAVLKRTNGSVLDSVRVPGSQWSPSSTRRIVLRYDALADPTGVYDYEVEVRSKYRNGTLYPSMARGQLLVVNRSTSPFGAGWWLAGLERLYLGLRPDTILWVGGDGSAHLYARSGTNPNVYLAPRIDQPDSIVKVNDTTYVRYLPRKLRVEFNNRGWHVATVNRLGHRTVFEYDPTTGAVTTIVVPPGKAKTYTFAYSGGKLDTISSPGPGPSANEQRRRTRVNTTGGILNWIRDCDAIAGVPCADMSTVTFAYVPGTYLISRRTDPLSHSMYFGYDSLYRLATDSLDMGAGQAPIVTHYGGAAPLARPRATVAAAVPPDSVDLVVNGPRRDTTVTRFWLDQFGAPREIKDAIGYTTVLDRSDPNWPALVTRVRFPNGRVTAATYEAARGLVLSITDSSTNATTRYTWHPTYEGVTTITLPEGEETHFTYDPGTGNRLSMYPGPDSSRATRFTYNALGLVATIKTPLVQHVDSVLYDGLGNVVRTRTPRGAATIYARDSLGRVTMVQSPLDSLTTFVQNKWLTHTYFYDAFDRDSVEITSGPAVSYTMPFGGRLVSGAAQTLRIDRAYDADGRLIRLVRTLSDEPNSLATRWTYDAADRVVKRVEPNGSRDSTVYDAAGNAVQVITRLNDVLTMQYDKLNRLVKRVIPAFTITPTTIDGRTVPRYGTMSRPAETEYYAYDAMGNLTVATNLDAQITREYFPNGLLKKDSIAVISFDRTRWDRHNYALQYVYDRNGRRVKLIHPRQLAPRDTFGSVYDTTTYTYNPITGQLATIRDPLGGVFAYKYDLEGRVALTTAPNGVTTSYSYDDATGDGLLRRMDAYTRGECWMVGGNQVILNFPDAIFADVLEHDLRGKVWRVTSPDQTHAGYRRSVSYRYTPLGALITADDDSITTFWPTYCGQTPSDPELYWRNTYSTWRVDALGNIKEASYQQFIVGSSSSLSFGRDTTSYDPVTLQLHHTTILSGSGLEQFRDTARYNAAGDRTYLYRFDDYNSTEQRAASYYNAAGRLLLTDRQASGPASPNNYPWSAGGQQQYLYDALGRRLQTTTSYDAACKGLGCRKIVERYVWDGDQLLYEIRYPGDSSQYWDKETGLVVNRGLTDYGHFGRVLYTHGLLLDQPVGLLRLDYGPGWFRAPVRITPHWNWRGVAIVGTFDDQKRYHCHSATGGFMFDPADTACVEVGWAGDLSAWYRSQQVYTDNGSPPIWEGSLIRQKADSRDQLYMRNRYYDPIQGRFTQEDPIGLAGGMNLYGYADGDPVNYSDPFGLCPLCVAYAIFEVGSTLYDLGDLAVTAYRHHQGKVSDAELALTATGVAIGLVSFGGGYGKASRELIGFVPGKWLTHFEKHGAEFGAKNAVEYLKGANKLISGGEGVEVAIRKNGDKLFYRSATNEFAVVTKDGKAIRTYFKPNRGRDYFLEQAAK
jgi:RHS repeat-associated protein